MHNSFKSCLIYKLSMFFKYFTKTNISEKEKNKKLSNLIEFVSKNSIFYKDCRKLEDFPVIDKKIMNEKFNTINTVGLDFDICMSFLKEQEKKRKFENFSNDISIGMSSGTSGNPSLFVSSKIERIKWAATILSKSVNIFKKQRIALFLRNNNELYKTLNFGHIKFMYFDTMKNIDDYLSDLEKFNPTILVAPAQILKYLSLSKIDINPKCYSVAEILDEKTKYIIQKKWKNVGEIYQATEGFIAITCEHGKLHLNDNIILEKEYLDENRFIPIITDIERYSQPIIRYRLNDILVMEENKCLCGKHNVIKKIEGRENDCIKIDSIVFFPDNIMKIICNALNIYRIENKNTDIDEKLKNFEFNLEFNDNFCFYVNDFRIGEYVLNYLQTYIENEIRHKKINKNISFQIKEYKKDFYNKRRKIINLTKNTNENNHD